VKDTLLAVLMAICVAAFVYAYTAPVEAAPSDPAIPDCVAIGKSGPLVVSRCEDDETGDVIYVNNYGMMVVEQ
jgi:hypothetical protein